MKVIKITDELWTKLSTDKGDESFSSFIEKKIYAPAAPTNISTPVENKLIAPLNTSFDPEPEPESLDLPFDCCKELIITNGAKCCQHWHRRGYGFIHSITRKSSTEYNPDGEYDPEYCEYL